MGYIVQVNIQRKKNILSPAFEYWGFEKEECQNKEYQTPSMIRPQEGSFFINFLYRLRHLYKWSSLPLTLPCYQKLSCKGRYGIIDARYLSLLCLLTWIRISFVCSASDFNRSSLFWRFASSTLSRLSRASSDWRSETNRWWWASYRFSSRCLKPFW